jgi:hypothetical protein
MAQPAQEGRGPRLVIANPRVSFKVLDIHDNARDSLTRGINSFLDTGGSSPLMLDGRLHGEEKPLREVYDAIVSPNNVQRCYVEGGLRQVDNREWIRVEGNVVSEYLPIFSCNKRPFNLSLFDEVGIYPVGWTSRLKQNRPFGLMEFKYVERGEVSVYCIHASWCGI